MPVRELGADEGDVVLRRQAGDNGGVDGGPEIGGGEGGEGRNVNSGGADKERPVGSSCGKRRRIGDAEAGTEDGHGQVHFVGGFGSGEQTAPFLSALKFLFKTNNMMDRYHSHHLLFL